MCCGLRLHVIIISAFGIIFSGFLHFTWNFTPYESVQKSNKNTERTTAIHLDNNAMILLRCLKFLEYMNLVSNICSLIGAIKCKKYLLIPYMVINLIWTLLVVVSVLLFLILGLQLTGDGVFQAMEKDEDLTIYFTVLVPLLTSLGIYLYGFVIVVLFYKAISSGNIPYRNTRCAVSNSHITNRVPDQPIPSITPSPRPQYEMTTQSYYQDERAQAPSGRWPSTYPDDPPPPYSYERPPPKNPFL